MRDALFAAGAGRIGDYERCSWYTEGTGTFLGGADTTPALGELGREERVRELRLETVFPAELHDDILAALRARASLRGARLRRLRAAVKARLFTDGGARGNPGPGGVRLRARGRATAPCSTRAASDRRRDEQRRRVPRARRRARAAVARGVTELEVVSDSELLVKQMRGEYKVKNEALRALTTRRTARRASSATSPTRHVRREHNELADRLVNEALDAAG